MNGVEEDEEGFRSLRKTVKRFMELLEDRAQLKETTRGEET